MHDMLLILHSWVRWAVLLAGLAACTSITLRMYARMSKKDDSKAANAINSILGQLGANFDAKFLFRCNCRIG